MMFVENISFPLWMWTLPLIMAWAWVPAAITSGLSIISSLIGGGQAEKGIKGSELKDVEALGEMPAIGEPDWGRMSEQYKELLEGMLQPQLDPDRLLLEAQRMDVAGSGAYLQGVAQMEQKYMDVMSREMGIFELQQAQSQTQWEQKKFLLQHDWEKQQALIERQWSEKQAVQQAGISQQMGQQKAGMWESIFGAAAGGIQGGFGAMQEQNWMNQLTELFGTEGFDFMQMKNLSQMGQPYTPAPFEFKAK